GLFRDLTGRVAGIHRTFLDPATGSKAPVFPTKKLSAAIYPGAYRGTAIQLFPADGPCLALAEGIETGLAVRELSGLPVWAAGCAAMLSAAQVPDCVREVHIWTDHDHNDAGQRAARQAARRLADEGRRVLIHIPPEPGTDWLDFLRLKNASR
ncbi:MAG: zinc-binding protein, partial [Clostridia bacterium]|nr:zinc-binding protein [Clostridia bacterium]